MPIDVALIPEIIKTAETRLVEPWKKDYFDKVARSLQVHTKGQLFSKVDTLFPNEHPDSKAHCLATYEPITKGSIWKGINNLKRIFSHSSFSFNVGDQLADWIADYKYEGQNIIHYFLEAWVNHAVAEDPNGLFVIYPLEWAEERGICPIQFVRSELIRSPVGGRLAFISELDSVVKYDYETFAAKREVFIDPGTVRPSAAGHLNARDWTETTYNQRLKVSVIKPVVHVFTLDGILIYKKQANDQFEWETIDFDKPMEMLPAFPGGGPVADKADQLLFESFVGPFIPFGNLSLLQHRNHRAVDLQFSYPRMSELQTPCDYAGCTGGRVSCSRDINPLGYQSCPKCKGAGWVTVQSPYKVYTPKYDPNDAGNNEHLKIDPVKFYSPEVGIIDYSKEAWRDYLKMAEEAIFVQQKVYTGNTQSAESKNIDLEELYSWLTNISRVFYANLRTCLQALENYVNPSPVTVSVEAPFSFAVLTEAEAFEALTKILGSNAPIFVKANEVENFCSKFISKDSPVTRALKVLKIYDPLLFYSNNEIQSFKGSGAISQEMVTKHVLAYPLLLKLFHADPTIFEVNEPEAIMAKLDTEIKNLGIEAPDEGFRRRITATLENE